MTRDQFHNAMRVLLNIEVEQLRSIGMSTDQIQAFFANPLVFFIKAGDEICDALWAIVEERINRMRG